MEILRDKSYAEAQSRRIPRTIYERFDRRLQIKPSDKVLEIGVGNGEFLSYLSQFTPHVYGVDNDPQAVNSAQLRSPNAKVAIANAENLPFANDTFDKVVSIHALEHIDDLERTIVELHRVTKIRGQHYHIVPVDYVCRAEGSFFDALKMRPKNPLKALFLAHKIHKRSFTDKIIFTMNQDAPFTIAAGKFLVRELPPRYNTGIFLLKTHNGLIYRRERVVGAYLRSIGYE
ncbi:MAG: class I SAM-dependent methyltransferase [Candidatus Levybacteria bacterium]|nr:class I SAM-dependent methyltransferase [Candidatus Levybacteria bacterium]